MSDPICTSAIKIEYGPRVLAKLPRSTRKTRPIARYVTLVALPPFGEDQNDEDRQTAIERWIESTHPGAGIEPVDFIWCWE